ncbi:electron transporter RnfC [uncultured Pseudodesulfovibrio sp.]|uniref:electron transporter RnfC n=1 Tax=uncultured Pseudodesulfovibrio sp. TaxID=2035858 RepID=UPI0029C8F054|nr:electron transporter RnfC [uncultured Pseudodesulfovibrio sp.]
MTEGDQVLAGTKIATAKRHGDGDLHSPLAGIIRAVHDYVIDIEITGNERTSPNSFAADGSTSLKDWLHDLGVKTSEMKQAATLVINAVPPEPGISIHEPLLRDYRKTIELGLQTVQRIVSPSKIYLATAKGNRTNAFSNCTVTYVTPVHPNGVEPLIIKKVTGQEVLLGAKPDNVVLISVRELYFIGKVMETGRPVTETVMTIGKQNHLVHVGTPVGFLASESGITPQPGDRIIMGGLMRGMAARDLEQGVTKETTGLNILRTDEAFMASDNPCLGCGECERRCPARIMPGMLSRCAEFKYFERAEAFHIHSCIECGICGYWCKAQRPLLQYIRLAKYELALLRSNNADNDRNGETQ